MSKALFAPLDAHGLVELPEVSVVRHDNLTI
jgi:hypothetical protein